MNEIANEIVTPIINFFEYWYLNGDISEINIETINYEKQVGITLGNIPLVENILTGWDLEIIVSTTLYMRILRDMMSINEEDYPSTRLENYLRKELIYFKDKNKSLDISIKPIYV